MKYEKKNDNPRAPMATRTVPPTVWAQTWTDRPTEALELGLRRLSETDLGQIESLANRRAQQLHPEDAELASRAFNRALVKYALSRILCTPDCADVPFFDVPDLVAMIAFDDAGASWLYAEAYMETVRTSPLGHEGDPLEALMRLGERCAEIANLPLVKRYQVIRLVLTALAILDEG